MRGIATTFCLILTGFLPVKSQQPLSYYLPAGVSYTNTIPTPESFLGWPVGKWHASHDQVVAYMRQLAALSPRITLEEYGKTEEERPLLLLTITSPGNHSRLEEIREEHLRLCEPGESGKLNVANMPVILYMGYSVHGNEASGTNAAMLVAYHLAAAQSAKMDSMLGNAVILLDPCLNPDGGSRFASWVNAHKSHTLVPNSQSREFNEAWPNGRTNHYWFDLNRDWLPVQQVESRGRMLNYHRWKPNVLTDHHEMGTNSTFFFQPGVPSRTHPLTPAKNFYLTEKIGKYHAAALDKIGSLYYTKESFDDFYYGKGSTYPDINGGVGILFEQASARGHLQESVHGPLSFSFTIRNQFTTSMSTLNAALDLREELLDFQRQFYKDAVRESREDATKAYVFDCRNDRGRLYHFMELLRMHQIRIYKLGKDIEAGGRKFYRETSYIMPLEQNQYRLIKAVFETIKSFQDSLFYDVSSWTLPLSFNLDYQALGKRDYSQNLLGDEQVNIEKPVGRMLGPKSDYGYVFEWDEYYAPRVVNALLQKNLVVKTATKPFTSFTAAGSRDFDYGTILIPAQRQGNVGEKEIYQMLGKLAEENGLNVYSLTTGLTLKGIDIGSPSFVTVKRPHVLMLVGAGVNAYDAGAVWQLLDKRVGMPLVMVEKDIFNSMDFDQFNTIIMVEGSYHDIIPPAIERMRDWIEEGGNLIAIRGAIKWCKKNDLVNLTYKAVKKKEDTLSVPKRLYAYLDRDRGAQVIGGAIFEVKIDLTHPLGYGFDRPTLPVFRRDTVFYQPSRNPYATPMHYTADPLLSGYISDQKHELLKSSAAAIVNGFGKGKIICLADDPNFRAFWYGTNKIFLNALFFAPIIDRYSVEIVPKPRKTTDKKEKSPTN